MWSILSGPLSSPWMSVTSFCFVACFPAHKHFLTHFSFHTYSLPVESTPGYCRLQLRKQASWLRTTQKAQAGTSTQPLASLASMLSGAQLYLASPQRVLRMCLGHRPGTPVRAMRFLEYRSGRKAGGWQGTLGPAHLWLLSMITKLFSYSSSWSHSTVWGDLTDQSRHS